MGKNKHCDCRYFKNGYCAATEGACEHAKNPSECWNYEASGLGKERTIERNKARKEKARRDWDQDD